MLFLGTHLATGFTTCPHLSWLIPKFFVIVFQNSSKFVFYSGLKLWSCLDYAISVLPCFNVRASGCWRYELCVLSCSVTTNAAGQCQNSNLELAQDIGEAANFATYFSGSPAAESTPHLYISALATWLWDTSLCQNWKKQFSCIPIFTHTKGSVDLPLMTISAGSEINAVMFSSDGMQIVSGSEDCSVTVWDASTDAELNKLNGHTGSVKSVVMAHRLCLALSLLTSLCRCGMYQQVQS